MRSVVPRRLAAGGLALGVALARPAGGADDVARRSAVLARVGPEVVTVGAFEDRLATMPPLQLALYGATVPEARRSFLEREVIREELLVAGARARHLENEPVVRESLRRARADAALRAVRGAVPPAPTIPADEIGKYYESHRERYEQPEKLLLHRILVATREEAEALLATLRKDATPSSFQALARDKSLDKATNLRGGNLGFVGPDGASSEVGLHVEPGLYKAALAVKDGEVVPTPVPEGKAFAVVARRGTLPARRIALADATPRIRETLHREAIERAGRDLIERLRQEHLRDVDTSPLLTLVVSGPDDLTAPTKAP